MKLVCYRWGGRRRVGRMIDADRVVELDLGERGRQVGVLALIEAGFGATGAADTPRAADWRPREIGASLPLSVVELEAPLPVPRRNLFCVGRNYHEHAKELAGSVFRGSGDSKTATWPIVFTKVPESVIAHGQPVRLPGAAVSTAIDYEAELAIVIGRGGRNIARARAMDHVWGSTIVNDVTARDVQMRHSQWDLGKSFDTFCPMGPCLVTADELDPRDVALRCEVNGELRQSARTRDLIFDIPTLIETVSRGITLYPGDVIVTGTPAGVGQGFDPPRYLQRGDRVSITIEGIGTLENPFEEL